MDNLNSIVLGAALGVITLTLQLIDYRPLRNSFLVLILTWLFALITDFPWPTENYARIIFIIVAILIMIPTMPILDIMFMKGKDKAVGFAFLIFLLLALMIAMLIAIEGDVLLWFIFAGLPIMLIVLMTVCSGVYQKIIKSINEFWNRKKNWRIKLDYKALRKSLQNDQDYIWGLLLAIVVFLFIFLLIVMTRTVYPLYPESPLYEFFLTVNLAALILGLILIFHSSLLNDDPNWPHGKKEKNGEKESKASIFFIKLFLYGEMLIGVVCILISTNNFALLLQQ